MANSSYDKISESFVKQLQKGIVPWFRFKDLPDQNIRGIPYNGINKILLASYEFDSPFWLTKYQAKERGGSIPKDAKPSTIVYWNWSWGAKHKNASNDKIPLLRYYDIFNLTQANDVGKRNEPTEREIVKPEQILKKFKDKPAIVYSSKESTYNFVKDELIVQENDGSDKFYFKLFRGLILSTASEGRVNRKRLENEDEVSNDKYEYNLENLIADIGAHLLVTLCNIDYKPEVDKEYLKKWIAMLSSDTTLIFRACYMAQKAADYIVGKKNYSDVKSSHE